MLFGEIAAIPDSFGLSERTMALEGLSVGTSPATSSWEGRQGTRLNTTEIELGPLNEVIQVR